MKAIILAPVVALLAILFAPHAQAQEPSAAPSDKAVTAKVREAIENAGVDSRRTSVRVITTSDHTVYLSGLISDKELIKAVGTAAANAAPGYKVINNIHSSFFDDPNHVNADKTK